MHGNRCLGYIPTFSFGSYGITDLEGCLGNFTSTLWGLYPGKRKPRERNGFSRDLELEFRLGSESDFLVFHSRVLSVLYFKKVSCIKTAWIFFIGADSAFI